MTPRQATPHALYVAWGYPPSRGGGVYRALATSNSLAAHGFRTTVLTADRETFLRFTGADTSLESRIDPAVEVMRVPFTWPALDTDLRNWSLFRVLFPRLWSRWRRWRDTRLFPEVGYGPWKKPLVDAAEQIHRADPVDLVVASANPNVDFAVAGHLHDAHRIPYVMDYRDAWILDVFDGSLLHERDSKPAALERRLLAGAAEIWFVNEPIRAWHQQEHPASADRMYVVANGFDPEFAPTPRLRPPVGERPLRFGYIGTVSKKVPVAQFAEGWARARARSASMAGAEAQIWGYLGFYSTPDAALSQLVESYAGHGVTYAGPIAKDDVRTVYETFDALLLILGAGRYVTSGKVFEYMASALPIVSIHDPMNAASDVLRDYPLWFPTRDLGTEEIARALTEAADAARLASATQREACRDIAQRYSRALQLAPRVQALHDLAMDDDRRAMS